MERALPQVWNRRVARLPDHGVLLVATDLQGNLADYERMKALYAADGDDPKLGDYAKLLYGQALIAEGAAPPEPAEFARLVAGLMV